MNKNLLNRKKIKWGLDIGYNGSENFAEGKRYGTFPSFSVGDRKSVV